MDLNKTVFSPILDILKGVRLSQGKDEEKVNFLLCRESMEHSFISVRPRLDLNK